MNLTDVRRKAILDAIAARCNGGAKLQIYTGSKPATANAAATGTKLAEFTLASTGFAAATGTGGVTCTATANTIADVSGLAAGTAGYARLVESDGTTVVGDFTVSNTGSGGEVQFANVAAFNTGVTDSITSFTLNMAA